MKGGQCGETVRENLTADFAAVKNRKKFIKKEILNVQKNGKDPLIGQVCAHILVS